MKKPKILVVDDNNLLRGEYCQSLRAAGFEVDQISDGSNLIKALKKTPFNVVLSDTEMDTLDGPEACNEAIDLGYLDGTLVLGMSKDSDNQPRWAGICQHAGFFDKDYFVNMGEEIMNRYRNFSKANKGSLWREKSKKRFWEE